MDSSQDEDYQDNYQDKEYPHYFKDKRNLPQDKRSQDRNLNSHLNTRKKRMIAFKTEPSPLEDEETIARNAGFTLITEFDGFDEEIQERMTSAIKANLDMDPDHPFSCGCPTHGKANCLNDEVCTNRARGIACFQKGHTCCNNPWATPNGFAVQQGKLYALELGGKGFGLFAREKILKGTFLGEYLGVLMKDEDVDRNDGPVMSYLMTIPNTGVSINPLTHGGTMRLCNHSCTPNSSAEPYVWNGRYTVVYIAAQNINIHEEITINYGWEYKEGEILMECKCGSSDCTGRIGKYQNPYDLLEMPQPFGNILKGDNKAFWRQELEKSKAHVLNPYKTENHCFEGGNAVGYIDRVDHDLLGVYTGRVLECLKNNKGYMFYVIRRDEEASTDKIFPMFIVFSTAEDASLALNSFFTKDEKENIKKFLNMRKCLIENFSKEILPNYVRCLAYKKIPRKKIKRSNNGLPGIGRAKSYLEFEKTPSEMINVHVDVEESTTVEKGFVANSSAILSFREYLQKYKYPGLIPREQPPQEVDVETHEKAKESSDEEDDSEPEVGIEQFRMPINLDYLFDSARDLKPTIEEIRNEVFLERFIYYSAENTVIHVLRRMPIGFTMSYDEAFTFCYDVFQKLYCNTDATKLVFLYYEHFCLFCEMRKPTSLSTLTCTICHPVVQMEHRNAFNQHFHQHHAICARMYICRICNRDFILPSQLVTHAIQCDPVLANRVPDNFVRFLVDSFADGTGMRQNNGKIFHIIKPGFPTRLFDAKNQNTEGVEIPIDVKTGQALYCVPGIEAKPIKFTVQKTHTAAQDLDDTFKKTFSTVRKKGKLMEEDKMTEESDIEDIDSFVKKLEDAKEIKKKNKEKKNAKAKQAADKKKEEKETAPKKIGKVSRPAILANLENGPSKEEEKKETPSKDTHNRSSNANKPTILSNVARSILANQKKTAPAPPEVINLEDDDDNIVEEDQNVVVKLPGFTPEMRVMFKAAKEQQDETKVLTRVYTGRDHIQLNKKDLKALWQNSWLNDNIISAYLGLINRRSQQEQEGILKVYVFVTGFYGFITTFGQYTYHNVHRWTRKVNIFQFDLIMVPIHGDLHWSLVCIDNRSHRVTYYDSLNRSNDKCLINILKYMRDEMKDKLNLNLDKKMWKIGYMRGIPQQAADSGDCGVFICKYAEYLSRDADLTFSQQDMKYYRLRMIYELLQSNLVTDPVRLQFAPQPAPRFEEIQLELEQVRVQQGNQERNHDGGEQEGDNEEQGDDNNVIELD